MRAKQVPPILAAIMLMISLTACAPPLPAYTLRIPNAH